MTALPRGLARRLRYAWTGGTSGTLMYGWTEPIEGPWVLEVRVDAERIDRATALEFAARQTLPELRVVGFEGRSEEAREVWRIEPEDDGWSGATARFTWSPSVDAEELAAESLLDRLVDLEPTLLEAAASVLLAEELAAVCLHRPSTRAVPEPTETRDLLAPPHLQRLVVATDARPDLPSKFIGPDGLLTNDARASRHRRGPYLWSGDPGPRAIVRLRDAGRTPRLPPTPDDARPALLVTAPFVARGGAEHTLLETLRVLAPRYRIAWATLAPHVAARGDRRGDFADVAPRLLSLGDLVHPAAMPGLLRSLLDSTGARCWYNANGTTLFYDFAPSIAAERRDLRIVDHLYDHRVGYIDRYGPALLDTVDACIAENHPIADALVADHSWPRDRAPVVWPCGRPRAEYARGAERDRIRRALRAELRAADDDVLLLTAARLHAQKRPLDLVQLALRLRDEPRLRILLAGGGDLEDEVRAAIDEATGDGARIVHLGLRGDIPRLLCAADVGCLVSQYEGLPVFLLECLQMGLPFLGTDVGDLGRVLRETGAGLVVDTPGDLDALETAARVLVDPVRREALARRAEAAGARFDVETCAARYARVFDGEATS